VELSQNSKVKKKKYKVLIKKLKFKSQKCAPGGKNRFAFLTFEF
jgi:hypothetical protein